jgi:hypothetical protein
MAETTIRLASFQIAGVPQTTGSPSMPVSAPTSGPLTPAGAPVAGTAPTTGPMPGTRDERERLMPGPPPRDVAPPSEQAKSDAPLGLLLLFAAAIYFLAK